MPRKKNPNRIEFQKWKDGHIWIVLYVNNIREQWIRQKGSKLKSKLDVEKRLKDIKSLDIKRPRSIFSFGNVDNTREITITKNDTIPKRAFSSAYVVSGVVNGTLISRRGLVVGRKLSSGYVVSKQMSKDMARENFWRSVTYELGGMSDDFEETILRNQNEKFVEGYKEGWVYYVRNKKQKS